MKHREILKNALRQCLQEKATTFDAITDQIERSAALVKELGGLQALEITEFDRAMISSMIARQVQLGIDRGDFDFVFRTPAPVEIPEFHIARLDLKPGDTIVIKSRRQLEPELRDQLGAVVLKCFGPGYRVIVLDDGLDLSLINEGETDSAKTV